jgi:hypothetical protein
MRRALFGRFGDPRGVLADIRARAGRRRSSALGGRITSELDAQRVAEIWMIACIDDNPGLIYASVAKRLNIHEATVRQIVGIWRELFRPGINPKDDDKKRLEDLKRSCVRLIDKDRQKSTITAQEYDDLKHEIDVSDLKRWCFRSQFRRDLGHARSPTDEIKVGIDYIEIHRKAYLEFAEKARQDRTFMAPLWSIVFTLVLGLIALSLNFYVGIEANKLKKQELVLKREELAKPPLAPQNASPPAH